MLLVVLAHQVKLLLVILLTVEDTLPGCWSFQLLLYYQSVCQPVCVFMCLSVCLSSSLFSRLLYQSWRFKPLSASVLAFLLCFLVFLWSHKSHWVQHPYSVFSAIDVSLVSSVFVIRCLDIFLDALFSTINLNDCNKTHKNGIPAIQSTTRDVCNKIPVAHQHDADGCSENILHIITGQRSPAKWQFVMTLSWQNATSVRTSSSDKVFRFYFLKELHPPSFFLVSLC